jgi:hypothetical protein
MLPGFSCLIIGFVWLFQAWFWVSPILFAVGGAFLSYGKRTTFDFKKNVLIFQDSVYGVPLKLNLTSYDLTEFEKIEISQASESGGRSFGGVISASYSYRHFPVNLIRSSNGEKILISEFDKYPLAKKFTQNLSGKMKIEIRDRLLEKIAERKRSQKEIR